SVFLAAVVATGPAKATDALRGIDALLASGDGVAAARMADSLLVLAHGNERIDTLDSLTAVFERRTFLKLARGYSDSLMSAAPGVIAGESARMARILHRHAVLHCATGDGTGGYADGVRALAIARRSPEISDTELADFLNDMASIAGNLSHPDSSLAYLKE